MKKHYFILVAVLTAYSTTAQIVNFLDPNFKNYLLNEITVDTDNDGSPDAGVDTNLDGEIQNSEAEAVTSLFVFSFFQINYTQGIEAFTHLKNLRISIPIASSALNSFTDLETLYMVYSNSNGVLTLSGLTHLKTVDCQGNDFSEINLVNLPALETFNMSSNPVQQVTFTGLPNLKELQCYSIPATNLNVAALPALVKFRAGGMANLTSIDFTHNPNLEFLFLRNFKGSAINLTNLPLLKYLDVSDGSLINLDVSQLTALENLSASGSQLTTINLGNLPMLKDFYCGNSNLSVLNLSGTPNIEDLHCGINHLSTLDVSNMPNLKSLQCNDNQIATLNIGTAPNLEYLYCDNNTISTLEVTPLTSLKTLVCDHNNIAALNIANLMNLKTLNCEQNNLTELSTGLLNLEFLNCSDNPLVTSTIDLTRSVDMEHLECANNHLTALSISHMHQLETFIVNGNQLTTLTFPTTNLHREGRNPIRSFYNCSGNLFTALDFSPLEADLVVVKVSDNPNLTYFNIKNESSSYYVSNLSNCPQLHYICINGNLSNPIPVIFPYIPAADLANIQINSYCSFNPGGVYNTISGTFSMDLDTNGCDANDFHFSNSKITIDHGTVSGSTFTLGNGNYSFFVQSGNFTVTPLFENPYFSVSPASATLNFAHVDSSTQTQHFCVIPNGVHKDLEITILPITTARPGFNATYQLVYKNKGNQTLSGNLSFTYDDAVLDFISADVAPTTQTTNSLIWAYNALKPFESRSVTFILNVNSPMETPAINNGDVLNFSAAIDPIAGDETIGDNTIALSQIVRGSFDPNDKTCLEGDTVTPEMVGGYLHYLIRFQNSGTAAAENIVVKDVLDATKFDISTFELTSASHPQTTKISGNKVEFQFENIHLPPEIENEPASHGYIAFKIKTKPGLAISSVISNKADIYFDYNFPITTNTATSTVAPLLANNNFENNSVLLSPNPTKGVVHIASKGTISSVLLFDVQGRILETVTAAGEQMDFDLGQQASGIYFVKVATEKGSKVQKIIKE